MEIERLGENKIRCALSEEEIREMGYNIDEIIGNTEVTQEFMRAVVELGIAEKTVKVHRSSIYRKLQVRTPLEVFKIIDSVYRGNNLFRSYEKTQFLDNLNNFL